MSSTLGDKTPNPRRVIATWQFWFGFTLILAISVQFSVAREFGDAAALLHAGEDYPASTFLIEELGDIPIFPSVGHDGQAFYVIARQPLGGDAAVLLDDPAMRYRRWLFPLVGGAFGTVSPQATVLGLAALAALGMAVAAAATVALAQRRRAATWWPALAVIANPGLWWALTLTTADTVGVGLSLTSLVAYSRRKLPLAIALAVGAALTKEQFLIVGLAIAANELHDRRIREATTAALAPIVGLGAISLYFAARLGGSGTVGENLSLPFQGFVDGARRWADFDPINSVLAIVTLVFLVAAAILALRVDWPVLRYLLLGWVVIGILAGEVIWVLGNNASRVFAMVPPLVALAATETPGSEIPTTESPPPPL